MHTLPAPAVRTAGGSRQLCLCSVNTALSGLLPPHSKAALTQLSTEASSASSNYRSQCLQPRGISAHKINAFFGLLVSQVLAFPLCKCLELGSVTLEKEAWAPRPKEHSKVS